MGSWGASLHRPGGTDRRPTASSPGCSSWLEWGLEGALRLQSGGQALVLGRVQAAVRRSLPRSLLSPPGLLPLLLRRNVQRVHDEANSLRDLLGPDCVLLKLGLHSRLGDALLEHTRGTERGRGHWPRARLWHPLPGTRLERAGEAQNRQTPGSKACAHLKSPLKILKLKHPHLKAFCKSAP